MLRVGVLSMIGSLLLLGLPVVVPLGAAAKYVVVPALVGFCFGLGCLLNGLIDVFSRGK